MNPAAWLVVAADGFRAVFIDHAGADRYATKCHGVVKPLFEKEPDGTNEHAAIGSDHPDAGDTSAGR